MVKQRPAGNWQTLADTTQRRQSKKAAQRKCSSDLPKKSRKIPVGVVALRLGGGANSLGDKNASDTKLVGAHWYQLRHLYAEAAARVMGGGGTKGY